ncbi:unnamed protein product [Heterobilharzia americana]|nr:unnamed protein product [Heterobilharzia americana]
MSAGIDLVQCFGDTPVTFDELTSKLCYPLSKFEEFSDTPELHQTLAHAELIVCRIRAYYNLIQEICKQSVNTGEAFSSSLLKLAKCIDLGVDQKQLWAFNTDFTSEWDHLGTQKILNHAAHLITLFAEQTRMLATKILDIETILTKINDSLNKLQDLRSNFQRAYERLENAINRAASASSSRSPLDLQTFDNQVKEAQEIYQTTATVYLSHIRQMTGPNYIISYLRLIILALSVQQFYSEQVNLIFDSSINQIKKLITNIEEKSNVMDSGKSKPLKTPICEMKGEVNLSTSLNPRLEGYLFKRSGKKGWRTWARRWFRVNDNQLVYCKRFPGLTSADLQSACDTAFLELTQRVNALSSCTNRLKNETDAKNYLENNLPTQLSCQAAPRWTVMETNLRFCTARVVQPNKRLTAGEKQMNLLHYVTDRRFVFELVSSGHRTYYLQAGSTDELNLWVNTLQSGLHELYPTNLPRYLKNEGLKESFTNDSLDLLSSCSPTQISLDFSNSPSVNSMSGFRTNDPFSQVSQSSLPDYDALKNKSGILLWREPDLAGNRCCADCAVGDARWASINLGVTLCTLCAAVHRSLGVHISKVRSLTLDNWQPELLHVMLNLGNKFVNEIVEANRPHHSVPEFPRLSTNTPFEQRKVWIEAKWVRFKFARLPISTGEEVSDSTEAVQWIKHLYDNWLQTRAQTRDNFPELIHHPTSSSPSSIRESNSLDKKLTRHNMRRYAILNQLMNIIKALHEKHTSNAKNSSRVLFRCAEQLAAAENLVCFGARLGCPLLILSGLAGGASPDAKLKVGVSSSYPPLILASRTGSIAASEFLLLNGADIDIRDDQGRTALHHACRFGRVHLVCLLLRRRANQMIADKDGKLPLDVALELANADIVTLLRLQRLNETAKSSDFTLSDETVNDVFRDFTSRTYYLNCDDYDNVDGDDDDGYEDDETICTNLESYELSLPRTDKKAYTTNKIIKIRSIYERNLQTLPSNNTNGVILITSTTTNTTSVASTPSTITTAATPACGAIAVDIRRRRDRSHQNSFDSSEK